METQLIVTIGGGAAVALLLLCIPNSTLIRLGKISFPSLGYRPFAPNWITAYGMVIALAGLWIYIRIPDLGFVITVFGFMLDRIDGKEAFLQMKTLSPSSQWSVGPRGQLLATVTTFTLKKEDSPKVTNDPSGLMGLFRKISRFLRKKKPILIGTDSIMEIAPCACKFHRLWAEFNFAGGTKLGEIFDPIGDKSKSIPFSIYLGYAGILNLWLVGILTILELVGTLIRPPFHLLERYTHTSKATSLGKIKFSLLTSTLILCVPTHQRWISLGHWAYGMDWIFVWLMGSVILMAALSILSRFWWFKRQKKAREIMNSLADSTGHEL
jgi:phosphatidylglycerophosphate synthase